MLQNAFKEWAVICQALADGKQSLILRKGGIAESGGAFAIEHGGFWLYPTYVHQQREGIQEAALPLLEKVEVTRPPQGLLRLSHFAELAGIYHVHNLVSALMLGHLHLWSEETVRQRFAYKTPGLYVLAVRVFRAKQVFELPELPAYEGCKSWVELENPLPTDHAVPVLEDEDFQDLLRRLDVVLNPTALA